jgi:hypothetical protein
VSAKAEAACFHDLREAQLELSEGTQVRLVLETDGEVPCEFLSYTNDHTALSTIRSGADTDEAHASKF